MLLSLSFVDLGSWSQVLSAEIYARRSKTEGDAQKAANKDEVCIIAVDLQPMAPLPGVVQLRGDITSEQTATDIIEKFHGHKADLVVCDGAPDGLHFAQIYFNHTRAFSDRIACFRRVSTEPTYICCKQAEQLNVRTSSSASFQAFNISTFILREGGTFVSKVFLASDGVLLKCQMSAFFRRVAFFKPQASRATSSGLQTIEAAFASRICRIFYCLYGLSPAGWLYAESLESNQRARLSYV